MTQRSIRSFFTSVKVTEDTEENEGKIAASHGSFVQREQNNKRSRKSSSSGSSPDIKKPCVPEILKEHNIEKDNVHVNVEKLSTNGSESKPILSNQD
jgi:hypothetical protein